MTTWNDSASLIHVERSQLHALESILIFHDNDTTLIVRKFDAEKSNTDTTKQASQRQSEFHSADTTQTTQETPLLAQSKKKGTEEALPQCVLFVFFFLLSFFITLYLVKKK